MSRRYVAHDASEDASSSSEIRTYSVNGVPVSVPSDFAAIRAYFADTLLRSGRHVISFVNPEIFLAAEANPFMAWYLQQTEHNFADGNGLLLAVNRLLGTSYGAADRYPGTDFFAYLPQERTVRVFLYGASEENSARAAEKISADFQNVIVAGRLDGYGALADDEIIARINDAAPDVLIVCLGCPRQECWILKNRDRLGAKIIFGNGGAIDFWSGSVRRAPDFMIRRRLEWLYRLGQDFSPARIRRQMRLVPFALRVAMRKFLVEERL